MRFKALFISPAMLVGLFFFLIVIHSLYKKQLKLCLENSISDFSYNREIRFTNGACTIVYNLVCTTIISNLVMIKVAKKKSIYIYPFIYTKEASFAVQNIARWTILCNAVGTSPI